MGSSGSPAGLVGQHQDVSGALGGATGLFHDLLDIAPAETVNVRARRSSGKVIVPWLRLPGRGPPNSASDKVFAHDTGRLFRVFPEDADRRQLAHCLKSNVTELRSHKVSWQIQSRNGRWLDTVVGRTRRNASVDLVWPYAVRRPPPYRYSRWFA